MKYLLAGVALATATLPAAAQDSKTVIADIAKVIKANPADLADQVKAVYKANKKNPEVLVGIGRAYLEAKDTANAKVYAEYALKRDRKYAPAYILAGDIEVHKDEGGAAAGYYQQAKYFDPKNPEAYFKYANVLRGRSPEEAVANLEELRTHRPDVAVDALIARIYYNSNMLDKSMASYEKVQKEKMEDVDITNYAMAGYLTQVRDKSSEMALYGLSKNPRMAAWNRIVFYNYTDESKFEDALAYADKLFNASDSAKISGYDYTYYGTALIGAKQYDTAVQALQKAYGLNEGNAELQLSNTKSLSDAYLGLSDYSNAVKYYEQYLAGVQKASASDFAGLASIYQSQAAELEGDAQKAAFLKADSVYAKLGELYPENMDFANFMRARVNSNLDPETKDGLAKPFYEDLATALAAKAERDNVDNTRLVEAYRYLGYYHLLKDDTNTANGYWEKVLELDPENEMAKKALSLTKKK